MANISWGQLNDIIVGFACKNARYREALLSEPKRILSAQIGQRLPDLLDVQVLEETADTIFLVLPHQVDDGGELSAADLDAVCGGGGRSAHVRKGIPGEGAGGLGEDGGEAGFQCQTYGSGNQGTHHDIDTEMSVF